MGLEFCLLRECWQGERDAKRQTTLLRNRPHQVEEGLEEGHYAKGTWLPVTFRATLSRDPSIAPQSPATAAQKAFDFLERGLLSASGSPRPANIPVLCISTRLRVGLFLRRSIVALVRQSQLGQVAYRVSVLAFGHFSGMLPLIWCDPRVQSVRVKRCRSKGLGWGKRRIWPS